MWDGFELPGELRRHPLTEAISVEAPVALVGASYGGLLCLDFAARHPELVTELVLLDAPLPDHEWSDEFTRYAEEEERLFESGDMDAVTELDLSFWAPKLAERLRPMARRAVDLDIQEVEGVDLSAVRARTLVAVGENDIRDFHEIAERLARKIEGAEHAVIPDAGHLPSMEQPEATAALVSRFLEGKT